ncbi:hypothetical protein EZS27_032868 [termite gut metagenome]|uniref:Magnesium transport protein CorA n=1 Tax=termite gut metagenome TaxID=433724 RepID=A0A5J4Q779_9ZZZZ
MVYSYHIFYFPFKWEIEKMKDQTFSEQINLDSIDYSFTTSGWERTPDVLNSQEQADLYNEKNYYYPFVHSVLYDNNNKDNSTLIRHFERKETKHGEVFYHIQTKDKSYQLRVDAINLNLYSTGVGFLSFFLENTEESQHEKEDILAINQYGRRIMPPFFADIEGRTEIAQYIQITGLYGHEWKYKETFDAYSNADIWKPASFIRNLIADLTTDISVEPIIDDRMFVNCWYANDSLVTEFSKKDEKEFNNYLLKDDFWYRYVFVDTNSITCQNDEMQMQILREQTYKRWQKKGMLYGFSHYSFVFLSQENEFHKNILAVHMRTIYSRMVELVLVQRASILCFSGEVTKISNLSNKKANSISERISSIYKEYIRFVNQIYFREVTAQDQGIELYDLMQKCLKINEYIKDLDSEIEELHRYVSLMEERERNRNVEWLNKVATVLLPATLIAGVFGMNYGDNIVNDYP